jgi:DNA-binding protein H-NS
MTNQFNLVEKPMEKSDLEGIPLDELWSLHEQITRVLSARIIAQKHELEQRLLQLNMGKVPADAVIIDLKPGEADSSRQRRKYPQVLPKYRNPSTPEETWSGRGKQPRWLVAALKAGGKMADFEISNEMSGRRARR